MKNIRNRKFGIGLLAIVIMIFLTLPTTVSADSIPTSPKIGISWITLYDNGWDNLPYADDDAEGFMDDLMDDPDTDWDDGFETSNSHVHDEQWEENDDEDYVDDVHFAYYAGHGWISPVGRVVLVFDANIFGTPIDSADIRTPANCDWGDENSRKLNWVVLACCDVAEEAHHALEGVHLICGWNTTCEDAPFGGMLAEELMKNETLKDSFFTTGDYYGETGQWMMVVSEDTSVSEDHIFWYGSVGSDPTVDSTYYEYDEPV
jgi:hypothetical protein